MTRLYAAEWAPEYGVSDQLDGHLSEGEAELKEHPELKLLDCAPQSQSLAFVDGVRRVEAQLFVKEDEQEPVPGIAGVFCSGWGAAPGGWRTEGRPG